MRAALRRYREHIALWMAARRGAGGALSEAQESSWTVDADALWTALTDDEQLALEKERQCRERLWRSGELEVCGRLDRSSALTGVCASCAQNKLPFAEQHRRALARELAELDARILVLNLAASPAEHPWRDE